MKKSAALIAALIVAVSASTAFSANEHDHGSMKMEHGTQMAEKGNAAHEETVDGVTVTFMIVSMKEQMKGMEMPKGMKETHHLMVEFKDAATGKSITDGRVRVKVQGPGKTVQMKDLTGMGGMKGMGGHFGADFDLSQKGKYGVMTKFILADGKMRNVKFWYEVK